jgi:hypothetical protein
LININKYRVCILNKDSQFLNKGSHNYNWGSQILIVFGCVWHGFLTLTGAVVGLALGPATAAIFFFWFWFFVSKIWPTATKATFLPLPHFPIFDGKVSYLGQ